ncbi:hypothetical protein [Flavobacterium ajazii]|uniref:hypothetical protein n=1 Tax=Flavobacterium ajazii TaxID=2692318 RepID=UPI0013D080AF|nr:hypothetical protein [Flavobacterium ajazii]
MKLELNIQDKKLKLIQWLSTLEDSTIIEKIIALRNNKSKDFWDSISETEKESIEQGLNDANSGKLNSHSSARKLYKKWL